MNTIEKDIKKIRTEITALAFRKKTCEMQGLESSARMLQGAIDHLHELIEYKEKENERMQSEHIV